MSFPRAMVGGGWGSRACVRVRACVRPPLDVSRHRTWGALSSRSSGVGVSQHTWEGGHGPLDAAEHRALALIYSVSR